VAWQSGGNVRPSSPGAVVNDVGNAVQNVFENVVRGIFGRN